MNEELAFLYLFPYGKFGYKAKREIPISLVKYYSQRLLSHTQSPASDADYDFFARSIVENNIVVISEYCYAENKTKL